MDDFNEEEEIKKRQEWNGSTVLYGGGKVINWDNGMQSYVLKKPKDCKKRFPESPYYLGDKAIIRKINYNIKVFEERKEKEPKRYEKKINELKETIEKLDPNGSSPVVHFAPMVKYEDAIKMMQGKRGFNCSGLQVHY